MLPDDQSISYSNFSPNVTLSHLNQNQKYSMFKLQILGHSELEFLGMGTRLSMHFYSALRVIFICTKQFKDLFPFPCHLHPDVVKLSMFLTSFSLINSFFSCASTKGSFFVLLGLSSSLLGSQPFLPSIKLYCEGKLSSSDLS